MRTFFSAITQYVVRRPFTRQVATVASGTAAAQIISVIFAPILTRMYGPEQIGILGIFLSLVMMIGPWAALTFPMAVMLPKEDEEARGLVRLSLTSAVTVSVLLLIALSLGKDFFGTLFELDQRYLLLVPCAVFFYALIDLQRQWLFRTGRFVTAAVVYATVMFLVNLSQTGIGLFLPSAEALIIITTIGYAVQAGCYLPTTPVLSVLRPFRSLRRSLTTLREMQKLAREHYDFLMFRTPQVLLSSFSVNLPALLLAAFFGPAPAGLYAIGRRILLMPSQLIAKSVADVFYPHVTATAHRQNPITPLIIKATLALAGIAVIPFTVVALWGPPLFAFVLGDEWRHAGRYAQLLSPWFFTAFINTPAVRAILVLHIQEQFLFFEVVSTVAKVLSLLAGYLYFESDTAAVALLSISGTILYLLLIGAVIIQARRWDHQRMRKRGMTS